MSAEDAEGAENFNTFLSTEEALDSVPAEMGGIP